jgi:hypothetical protein
MLRAGRWRATAVAKGPIASFHLNALYSPWARWSELVNEWLLAQEKLERLQAFVNTVKGETWEDKGGGLDPERLESRKEAYDARGARRRRRAHDGRGRPGGPPRVHHPGMGGGEESWLIDHDVILGDPAILPGEPNSPWDELDRSGKSGASSPSGRSMPHLDLLYRLRVSDRRRSTPIANRGSRSASSGEGLEHAGARDRPAQAEHEQQGSRPALRAGH